MANAPSQTFNFELVSPEKILISEPAWQVVIPGEDGYFGVRAGHMSLIAAIRPGVVEVIGKEGEQARKIFIAGGFADVSAQNCTILAEQAMNVNDLDLKQIDQEIEHIDSQLSAANDHQQKQVLVQKRMLAQSKRNAATAA